MIPLTTKASGLSIAPQVSAYCLKRLAVLDKYVEDDDTSASAHVELEKTTKHHQSGKIFRAEITLHTRRGNFRADARGESLQEAIDLMRDEIEQELRRAKEKGTDRVRRGGRRFKMLLQKK